MGGVGVARSVPDFAAIVNMNYTLGSSFSSRINMNLREVHGYTYGAFSSFDFYREGGPFFAGALVRTDVTAPAVKEMRLELDRILTEPPTPAELKMAKDARIHSLPALFETTSATAAALSSLFLYDRPLDYYAKRPALDEAVTLTDVAKAAKETIHPDQCIIVAVGDRSKIEPGLKDLNLAPIEYSDPLGNIVK